MSCDDGNLSSRKSRRFPGCSGGLISCILMETDELRLSYSRMKTYRQCSEAYRLKYEESLEEIPGWYNIGGTAVHAMTEAYDWESLGHDKVTKSYTDFFEEAQAEQEALTSVPAEEWKTAGRKTKALPKGEDKDWWLREGPSMVRRWINWRDSAPMDLWITPDGEPAIELSFDYELADGTRIRGAIDRVYKHREYDALVVVDIKSGKPPKDVVQLSTYGAAIKHRYGIPADFGGYWMARGGVLTGYHDLRPDQSGRMKHEYLEVAKGINAGVFYASESALCGYCSFAAYCYTQPGHSTEHLPFKEN